jgi:hypothetical protein
MGDPDPNIVAEGTSPADAKCLSGGVIMLIEGHNKRPYHLLWVGVQWRQGNCP